MTWRNFALAVILTAIFLVTTILPAGDYIVWKRIEAALLKIDEKPVKLWTLFHDEKDKHTKRLLLQLGARYLLIDTQNHAVEEFLPESFERHGKDLRQSRTGPAAKVLATSDWMLREAGMVRIIHVKLNEEGRAVEIQLPSLPDLRY